MRYTSLDYIPETEDPSITLETKTLVAKIIDNTGLLAPTTESDAYFNDSFRLVPFSHHLGYHGIRTLYDRTEKRNAVVPYVSWLNMQAVELKGINADPVDERAAYGVGRGWPMRMESTDRGVRLSIGPLPSMNLSYTLDIWPAEPDGFDFSVRFKFGAYPESGRSHFRASWACYVNSHYDARLHYPKGPSKEEWEWAYVGIQPDLILGETVGYEHKQEVFFPESPAMPLGVGRLGSYAMVLMFNDPKVRLFTVSGGGHRDFSVNQCPAWDFDWSIDDYPLNEPLGFDGRLLYTRFEGEEIIMDRYLEWCSTQ